MEDFLFLLPRPRWQPDDAALKCNRCHNSFSLFNRKHHCRHCGIVYCHNCCSRKTPLLQLGYHEPVKVCELCFEISYLVSYVLHMDSETTQLHGARGLLSLLANSDESRIRVFIKQGILEAFIFLSQRSLSPELHLLSTIALRFLIENDDLKYLLESSTTHEDSGSTFKVLIRTITSLLEMYTLVPEVKGDGIGVYSIHRIIFNTAFTASRMVLTLYHYPQSISMMIDSRWLYFFLDAIEQAMYDSGYLAKGGNSPKPKIKSGSPSMLYGLFDECSDEVTYTTPSSSPNPYSNKSPSLGPPNDLLLIALEIQNTTAKTILLLCQCGIRYQLLNKDRDVIIRRLKYILSLYQNTLTSDSIQNQNNLIETVKIIQDCIAIL